MIPIKTRPLRTPRLTIDQSAAPASEVVDPKVEGTELQDAAAKDFDEAMGLIKGTGQPSGAMLSVIPTPRSEPSLVLCSPYWCSRSALWDTLVIAFFVLIGAVIGQIRDGENGIVNFFGRLFSGR